MFICNRHFLIENVASTYNHTFYWSFMFVLVFAVPYRCLHTSIAAQTLNILAGFCVNRLSRQDQIYPIAIFIQINAVLIRVYMYFLKLSSWHLFSWKFYKDLPSPSYRRTIFTGGCSSRHLFIAVIGWWLKGLQAIFLSRSSPRVWLVLRARLALTSVWLKSAKKLRLFFRLLGNVQLTMERF